MGQFLNSAAFSSLVWGAWSEASTSMCPSRAALQSASTSLAGLRGGFILPYDLSFSQWRMFNNKWWGSRRM